MSSKEQVVLLLLDILKVWLSKLLCQPWRLKSPRTTEELAQLGGSACSPVAPLLPPPAWGYTWCVEALL